VANLPTTPGLSIHLWQATVEYAERLTLAGKRVPPEVVWASLFFQANATGGALPRQATTNERSGKSRVYVGPITATDDDLLRLDDVAASLAVCRRTVDRLLENGSLPFTKVRGARRVRRSDVAALAAGK
jgi:excisionase family DNA binding protein